MNIFALPAVGWMLGIAFYACLAVPFYLIWNALAPTYFYFIPLVYQQIDFWECVGLFIIVSILKTVMFPNQTRTL